MIAIRTAVVGFAVLTLGGCATMEKTRDAIVRRPSVCVDQTVQIYFETDSAEVTTEGQAVIQQAARDVRGCTVQRVDVMGLADAVGAPGVNLELSKRRAQSVTTALALAHLPAAEFHVTAAGQAGSMTSSGASAPLRRRVDVILRIAR